MLDMSCVGGGCMLAFRCTRIEARDSRKTDRRLKLEKLVSHSRNDVKSQVSRSENQKFERAEQKKKLRRNCCFEVLGLARHVQTLAPHRAVRCLKKRRSGRMANPRVSSRTSFVGIGHPSVILGLCHPLPTTCNYFDGSFRTSSAAQRH